MWLGTSESTTYRDTDASLCGENHVIVLAASASIRKPTGAVTPKRAVFPSIFLNPYGMLYNARLTKNPGPTLPPDIVQRKPSKYW